MRISSWSVNLSSCQIDEVASGHSWPFERPSRLGQAAAFAPSANAQASPADQAQFRRAAAHMAQSGHSRGAIFMPSGLSGFSFAEFPDFPGPPLRVCGFFGEGKDFMRLNPDGTATVHWVASGPAFVFPILADEPSYDGASRGRMNFTGILERGRRPPQRPAWNAGKCLSRDVSRLLSKARARAESRNQPPSRSTSTRT